MLTALDNHVEEYGVVTLPNGEVVSYYIKGYVEGSTNGWVEEEFSVRATWQVREMTPEELNTPIKCPVTGKELYLHEWVYELTVEDY